MLSMRAADDRIPKLLRAVTWLEVAVLLVAGGGLLLALPIIVGIWPWTLAPFNLRFLGALYSAALVAAFLQAWVGRWAPARTITWMIFVFTLVVTVLSFVHLGRFDPARPEVWVWFILYIGVCVNAGAHLAWYRDRIVVGQAPSMVWRRWLLLQSVLLGASGLALLLMPMLAASWWPWKLDRFHAQLYSVVFLTPAVGAHCLRRAAVPADWVAQGWTQLAWGLLPVAALVVVDVQVRRVDWAAWPVWIWLTQFVLIAGMGAAMLRVGVGGREVR